MIVFKKQPKDNSLPTGENSPHLVTLRVVAFVLFATTAVLSTSQV
jgi:nitrate reductase NapE component